MRIVIYIAAVVVTCLLTAGAGLLTAIEFAHAPAGLVIANAMGVAVFVMGPLLIGSLVAWWDVRSSPAGRRTIAWWFFGVLVLDVAGAVVVIVAAVSGQAPVWVPVVLIGGAALLLAVARPLGDVFRRTERPATAADARQEFSPGDVRRALRTVGITFLAAAVVSTAGMIALSGVDSGPTDAGDILESVLLGAQLTFTATAFAAVLVSLRFNTALRDSAGRDLGRLRRFGKVVLQGKNLPLDPQEQWGAARYASIAPLSSGFQIGYFVLLYIGIGANFASQLVTGGAFGRILPIVVLTLLFVMLAVIVPLFVVRSRRARAYAAAHEEMLRSPFPEFVGHHDLGVHE